MADLLLWSCGFKYGPPPANNYIDVSFLPNPGRMFGLDSVADHRHRAFILDQPATSALIDVLKELAVLLIEQRDRPVIAICCSSGRHRSPVVAELLAERLREEGYGVDVMHRDCHYA